MSEPTPIPTPPTPPQPAVESFEVQDIQEIPGAEPEAAAVVTEEQPMLDVHAPHESIHSWRDFFIHIATISIGLLIAIGLEQTVEYFHHLHLLHQARENIREEITENLIVLKDDRNALESNRRTLVRNIATLSTLKANPKQSHEPVLFPWQWNSPSQAAWQTAKDTGAIALMPYDQAQNYTMLYRQQDLVTEQALVYISHTNSAAIPMKIHQDLSQLSPAQLDEILHGCAASISDIENLEELMDSLEHAYANSLNNMSSRVPHR